MKIKHLPLYDIEKICKLQSKKEGVPIKYVCTTEMTLSDVPIDIFYRANHTPHPKFGNYYFGIYVDPFTNKTMITNADKVEDIDFLCVENDAGEMEYSEYRHAFKQFNNGNMIDGGRSYGRYAGMTPQVYNVYMGELRPFNELMAEGTHDD